MMVGFVWWDVVDVVVIGMGVVGLVVVLVVDCVGCSVVVFSKVV